jgi:parallel beta-helix repeat protein
MDNNRTFFYKHYMKNFKFNCKAYIFKGEGMKRTVCGTMLALFVLSMLTLAFNVQLVKAEPTTIVVPDDYPTIQEAVNAANPGDTIFVRAGIYYENVVIDKPINLIGEDFATISGFGLEYGPWGLVTITSSNVTICGFSIVNSSYFGAGIGIFINSVDYVNITRNVIRNHDYGIDIRYSTGDFISNNVISDCKTYGITIGFNSRNVILKGNNMTNNYVNLAVYDSYIHDIDATNLVDGKPVYYWVNQTQRVVPTNAGYVALINSKDIVVENLTISHSQIVLANTTSSILRNLIVSDGWYGIRLLSSNSNILTNLTLKKCIDGIRLDNSHNNIINNIKVFEFYDSAICLDKSDENLIFDNDITLNWEYASGICIWSASKNKIYHNNFFILEGYRVDIVKSKFNYWDDGYPSGGNYWSDYTGFDLYSGPYQNETGSDGIGDTPYIIDANNIDRYPLMKPYPWANHDVGITSVKVSKTIVGQGYSMSINVMVFNYGNGSENINAMVYANTAMIGEINNITIADRSSIILTFTWNTIGFAYGNYTIWAYVEPVLGETDTADNNMTSIIQVHVGVPGNVWGNPNPPPVYDDVCNMRDVTYLILHFNTKPGSPNWDPNADVNNDGICNMRDVTIAILNFNKHE